MGMMTRTVRVALPIQTATTTIGTHMSPEPHSSASIANPVAVISVVSTVKVRVAERTCGTKCK